MKIAILLCGHVRTWEKCKDHFRTTFGENVDIFVHTYDTLLGYHPYIEGKYKIQNNMYTTTFENIKKIVGNCTEIVIENQKEIEESLKEIVEQCPLNMDTYCQFRKIKLCDELRRNYEFKNNFKYDIVIKTRFDLKSSLSITQILSDFDKKFITISQGNLTVPQDHILIGTGVLIEKMANRLMDMEGKFPKERKYSPHEWLYIKCGNFLKVNNCLFIDIVRHS